MNAANTCPVCLSNEWRTILCLSSKESLTSDHRNIPRPLKKSVCVSCGAGRNSEPWQEDEIQAFYTEDYVLNTESTAEHVFFEGDREVKRSASYFSWIRPFLGDDPGSILEIGCGDGKILGRIRDEYTNKVAIEGIEGSKISVRRGQEAGLNIREGLILSEHDELPEVQVYLAIGVLEHTSDPAVFLQALRNTGKETSRYILTLPIQDDVNQDILFADHEWHFTSKHLYALFDRVGMKIIHMDHDNILNPGMVLIVAENKRDSNDVKWNSYDDRIENSMRKWSDLIPRINKALDSLKAQRLVLFGASEFLSIYYTYTSLKNLTPNVLYIVDETTSKIGTSKYGMLIKSINTLGEQSPDGVIVTTNPKYNDLISRKITEHYSGKIITLQ